MMILIQTLQIKKSIVYLEESRQFFETNFGKESWQISDVYFNLGNLFIITGALAESQHVLLKCLKIREKIYGNKNL